MTSKPPMDYWEVDPETQTAVLGEFSKTSTGSLISLISLKWSQKESVEIESFRIRPVASIKLGVSNKKDEKELLQKAKSLSKTLIEITKENNDSLPLEELESFNLKTRLAAWLEIRKKHKDKFYQDIENLGVNKFTTIDYLNLQSLGIKDYQKILAEKYEAKPLTIRDRIAYARRHKWIPPVGHGERTAEMTRLEK
jgi:hypothetical protein